MLLVRLHNFRQQPLLLSFFFEVSRKSEKVERAEKVDAGPRRRKHKRKTDILKRIREKDVRFGWHGSENFLWEKNRESANHPSGNLKRGYQKSLRRDLAK